MRTDVELMRDLPAEPDRALRVCTTSLGMSVHGAIVTPTGHMDPGARKCTAAHAAPRVDCADAVIVQLDMRLSLGHRRGDTRHAMRIDPTSEYQRPGIDRDVRRLDAWFCNPITLRPAAGFLERQIALAPEQQVRVAVEGNTLELSRTEPSLRERPTTKQVAWAPPGVHVVIDAMHAA